VRLLFAQPSLVVREVDRSVVKALFLLYIYVNQKNKIMYSLKCSYYTAEFTTLGDLIAHIMISGMDPNYEITKDGVGIGEEAINYIVF
jgi:hypothetical protein